ncbi:unnamed protein product [Cylicocyclus nassatus]|uniref:Uncharacterized protein n=1 Tax=Cylicocyclus nassatus TaxID=53992 RepID=A0AA36DPA8_CYLNA|nr:unnamed protein product [Cylicocyclus nassatus]
MTVAFGSVVCVIFLVHTSEGLLELPPCNDELGQFDELKRRELVAGVETAVAFISPSYRCKWQKLAYLYLASNGGQTYKRLASALTPANLVLKPINFTVTKLSAEKVSDILQPLAVDNEVTYPSEFGCYLDRTRAVCVFLQDPRFSLNLL